MLQNWLKLYNMYLSSKLLQAQIQVSILPQIPGWWCEHLPMLDTMRCIFMLLKETR